ncbi:hypothetical protein [Litoribacillus peritrichatus]|uniref:Lipoprotein n=1 Tax=Litoribacillus peritrichatus TaxID=718191 RepID=A0ABP7MCK9_9GAMM
MKNQSQIFKTIALSTVIGIAATGCGSQQTKPVSAMSAAEKAQLQQAQSTVDSIVQASADAFTKAEQANVPKFSQVYFPKAKTELQKLKKMHQEFNPNKSGIFASGYNLDDIKEQAAVVDKNVQGAEKTKFLIETNLKDVIDNQQYIETLDLSKFEKQYKSRQNDVTRLFKDLETAGQFQGLEDQRLKVLNDLRAFEVAVIKDKYYNQPQSDLKKLPEETIPATYKQAQEQLTKLSNTISATPRAMKTIESHQKSAIKALTKAQNILKEVKWIDENSEKGLEKVVLKYHQPMDRAFPAVLKEDHTELLFEDQVSKYSYLVTNLKSSLQKEVSSLDEAQIQEQAQKMADAKAAELKKTLEANQSKQALETEQKNKEELAAFQQQEALKTAEEKKRLKEEHKKQMDALIAQHNQLKLSFEKTSQELSQLKETQKQEREKNALVAAKNKTDTSPKASSQAASEPTPAEPQQVAATTNNSSASAPAQPAAPSAAKSAPEKPTADTASDTESAGFEYEIESIEL